MLDLAGGVALEAADDLPFRLALDSAARDVVDRGLMESHPDDDGSGDRGIQLPVARRG
ncbi:hypothetical protein OG462_42240 [Streptomyces sp. NBC_01077]|uniref:hypothetical protein n=1 Tax=Streptomyces sp. NBC_01077 TaxID=2903746 RepID=UPI0038685022|nr:hypothetical protein OG462_02780 [Streptomyces sp. NBC_01077]WSV43481.1 hypothetical protein OG462_42240 [Streptomyces sp. NBC_01077]